MAKIYLSRLQKKYGFKEDDIKRLNYRKLMKEIIQNQTENMSRATARISSKNYESQLKKIKEAEKKIILPDVQEVLPKKSVFIRKGAEDGNLITDKLRDQLTKNLRDSLQEFKTKKKGIPAFVRRAGKLAGTINPEVIKIFEDKIINTFQNYTKKDPRYGVPSNVKQIATTEIRSVVNQLKDEYNKNLLNKNRDKIKMYKQWRQNKRLSKEYRRGHDKVNGKKIEMDEVFQVPLIVKVKGRFVQKGITPMKHPHDPQAPADQVIGCNCDIVYFAVTI